MNQTKHFKFSKRSLDKLATVDKRLQKLVHRALELSEVDFTVICGIRTMEEQRELVRKRLSWTYNSKHLKGLAVDVVPYPVDWSPEPFAKINEAFKKASEELDIPYR